MIWTPTNGYDDKGSSLQHANYTDHNAIDGISSISSCILAKQALELQISNRILCIKFCCDKIPVIILECLMSSLKINVIYVLNYN